MPNDFLCFVFFLTAQPTTEQPVVLDIMVKFNSLSSCIIFSARLGTPAVTCQVYLWGDDCGCPHDACYQSPSTITRRLPHTDPSLQTPRLCILSSIQKMVSSHFSEHPVAQMNNMNTKLFLKTQTYLHFFCFCRFFFFLASLNKFTSNPHFTLVRITVLLHKTIPHPKVCRRKRHFNRVIHGSLFTMKWTKHKITYYTRTHTHAEQSWDQAEITEDSLASSAVLYSPPPHTHTLAENCCQGQCQRRHRKSGACLLCSSYDATILCRNALDWHYRRGVLYSGEWSNF